MTYGLFVVVEYFLSSEFFDTSFDITTSSENRIILAKNSLIVFKSMQTYLWGGVMKDPKRGPNNCSYYDIRSTLLQTRTVLQISL